MVSDVSYWKKILQESDLSMDDEILQNYSKILSENFRSIEELLTMDENDLVSLGIPDKFHCENLIKQARIIDEKESLPLIRQSNVSNSHWENWHRHSQSTPLNPKSKCNLSPALLSRISYNDHSFVDELTMKKCHFEHIIETPERSLGIDLPMITPTCSKRTPPASVPGMRIVKSISDTISIQKKILMGHDRLKRLTLTKSLLKRQTSFFTKKLANLKEKFRNPFNKIKTKPERITVDHIQIIPSKILIEKSVEQMQTLNLNTDEQYLKPPVQALPNRKFKLGTPTTFVNRSISNHVHFA